MEHPENDDQCKGLKVNKSIMDVPTVSPYIKKRVQHRVYTPPELVEDILKGDITIFSQATTLVESSKYEYQQVAQEIIEKCLPFTGKSVRTSVTGVPGTEKSASIDPFGMHSINRGREPAVLTIDPSSKCPKGNTLGDKTRMEALSKEKNAFIRPSPSADSLKGVARKTRETIVPCEATGFDTVFVETVGVGQSETAVHSMVGFFLLIQLVDTEDKSQGIKRGTMEMADGIIINKADGDDIEKANLAAARFRNALHLFLSSKLDWFPRVLTYFGYYSLGIKEIWDMTGEYIEFTKKNGYFDYKHNEQAKYWIYKGINDTLRGESYHNPAVEGVLEQTEKQVLNNEINSSVATKWITGLSLDNIATK